MADSPSSPLTNLQFAVPRSGTGSTTQSSDGSTAKKSVEEPCPQETCDDGHVVIRGDRRLCLHCRTTASGQYVPPDGSTSKDTPYGYDTPVSGMPARREDRDRYHNSRNVRLYGGFTEAHPDELTNSDDGAITLEGSRDRRELLGA